jgi:hypothetical protein
VHNNMGMLALQRGDLSAAAFHLDTSITLFRTTDHSAQLAHALYNRASVAADCKEWMLASTFTEESLFLAERGGDSYCLANGYQLQAIIEFFREDIDNAERMLAKSLYERQKLKDRRSLPGSLVWAAALAGKRGDHLRAVRYLGAVSAICSSLAAPLTSSEEQVFGAGIGQAKVALSPETYATAWEEGCGLRPDQAILQILAALPQVISPAR